MERSTPTPLHGMVAVVEEQDQATPPCGCGGPPQANAITCIYAHDEPRVEHTVGKETHALTSAGEGTTRVHKAILSTATYILALLLMMYSEQSSRSMQVKWTPNSANEDTCARRRILLP